MIQAAPHIVGLVPCTLCVPNMPKLQVPHRTCHTKWATENHDAKTLDEEMVDKDTEARATMNQAPSREPVVTNQPVSRSSLALPLPSGSRRQHPKANMGDE